MYNILVYVTYGLDYSKPVSISSLRANPLARSLGQVKLDLDKWKLRKNMFEYIENF
jgi:hypothetical protein